MRKEYVTSFKVSKTKGLTPILKGLSAISKLFHGKKEFSMQTSSVILASREEALRRGNDFIRLEHLLFSILKSGKGKAIEILKKLNCNIEALQQQIEAEINKLPQKDKNLKISFTTTANNALKSASSIADEFKSKEIENEHLLLAILKIETSSLVPVFQRFNITYHNCYHELKNSV